MADPLSIIAGVAGVTTAVVDLASNIHRICDKYKSAPQEMRKLARGMTHLSTILEDVGDVLDDSKRNGVYKPRVLTDTKSILDRFQNVIEEVTKIVERNESFRGRLRWVFDSSKVRELLCDRRRWAGSVRAGMVCAIK